MNGRIEYREFVQFLALLSGRCSQETLVKLAFLIIDQEGTGRVHTRALRGMVERHRARKARRAEAFIHAASMLSSAKSRVLTGRSVYTTRTPLSSPPTTSSRAAYPE